MKWRSLAAGIWFVCACGLAALETYASGRPLPREHDEFSYLLGAETLRSGRLTNPPHQLPEFFDTFHELQRPTYASKYPPGQALVLAVGWRIAGSPIVGVWLGFGAMALALYWAFGASLSETWAWVGAICVGTWLSLTYWANSYWGGCVAVAGGALVLGGALRLWEGPRLGAALGLALGLVVLANTRPFEGLVAATPPVMLVSVRLFRARRSIWPRLMHSVLLPLVTIGGASILAMAAYNRAVTRDALLLPHLAYARQMESAPLFVWQRPTRRAFDYQRRAVFQDWELQQFAELRHNYLGTVAGRVAALVSFFFPAALLFPLVFAWHGVRGPPGQMAGLAVGGLFASLAACTWFQTHYFAPFAAPIYAIYFMCLQSMARWTGHLSRVIRGLAWATPTVWVVFSVWFLSTEVLHPARRRTWSVARAHLADSLAADGRQHLLFVSYPVGYFLHAEWVFNGASIDSQRVIWAHDLGTRRDEDLMRYYPRAVSEFVELRADSTFYRIREAK